MSDMMLSTMAPPDRSIDRDAEILYDHWLECVRIEPSASVIQGFQQLFIEGQGYKNKQIAAVLETILKSKEGDLAYPYILSRCCQILIDRWYRNSNLEAITDLIARFESSPSPITTYNSSTRRQQLLQNFKKTEIYRKLQRLSGVICRQIAPTDEEGSFHAIGDLLYRYPYLYQHCLLGKDSTYQFQRIVQKVQSRMQQSSDVSLTQYMTYRVRLIQLARSGQLSTAAGRLIRRIDNPTLLNEKQIDKAFKEFVGRIEKGYSYRKLAGEFLDRTLWSPSYQAFKTELYEYLIAAIPPEYGQHHFYGQLEQKLQDILPHCDRQKPSKNLILRTVSHLFNFLIIDSPQNPNHYIFIDLITHLGSARTIAILLKLLLLSPQAQSHLEKRFALLFEHYETFSYQSVPWLIKALENLQIAISIHCGEADLSYLKMLKSAQK